MPSAVTTSVSRECVSLRLNESNNADTIRNGSNTTNLIANPKKFEHVQATVRAKYDGNGHRDDNDHRGNDQKRHEHSVSQERIIARKLTISSGLVGLRLTRPVESFIPDIRMGVPHLYAEGG